MTTLDAQADCAPPPAAAPSRVAWWVCTSNPFYALSALLVCLGLWVSFGKQDHASETWALLCGMSAYTLLLAATACLLVRCVGVWDDVRTVMLLVVLMILATSVTFDEVLARDPARGVACYLAGLAFASAVSEGLLRGCRLALPALFRAPYHLTLALFFLYPVAITPLLDRPEGEALEWALFGFSPAAGLVALTLLPAVRRGREYVRGNGSPWRWAWYPWTLYGVLVFAVVARSAMLCWSMHHAGRVGGVEPYIFGGYFLTPFLLCVAVVLLEIGLVEGHPGVRLAALAAPALLMVLAVAGHRPEPAYQWFLARFEGRLGGSPLFLTLLASAGFYAYAAYRRTPMAIEALCGSVAALAVVTPATRDLHGLVPARPLPILAIGVLQTAVGLRRRNGLRCLIGAACLGVSAMIALTGAGVVPSSWHRPIAYHATLAAILAFGAKRDDPFARLARFVGVAVAALAALAVTVGAVGDVPEWATRIYPPLVGLVLVGYGHAFRDPTARTAAGLIAVAWLTATAWGGYKSFRHVVAGLDYIVVGLALLALAVLTSVAKAGVQTHSKPTPDEGHDVLV